MTRKAKDENYGKREARERFEAALRGARHVNRDAKPEPMKRGRRSKENDPMPSRDAEALVRWGKRNIQRD